MTNFDYIIIGAGAAGLMLADAFGKDEHFKNKSILLLDKDAKNSNNRTWCFWEKNAGHFDEILHKEWAQISFAGKQINKTYPIAPYSYKMIRGIDFYTTFLKRIAQYKNITFLQEEVINLEYSSNEVIITTPLQSFKAKTVFNSIYNPKEPLKQIKYPVLQQHFIGWFIQTEEAVFDDATATFMDFSIPQKGNTRFMYVLPTSKKEALIEYTLFSDKLLEKHEYETAIKSYITNNLGIENYKIIEKEHGSIPMTSYNFADKNRNNLIYIGTAGGWTKASTGYTFNKTSKKVNLLIEHIKQGKPLSSFSKRDKFWFYDLLLLDILYKNNEKGQSIFEALFKNRKPQLIFKFLDEETSLWEDVKFISALSPMPFINALVRRIF